MTITDLHRLTLLLAFMLVLLPNSRVDAAELGADLPWTTLTEVDFATANQPVDRQRGHGSITGVLPTDWSLDASLGAGNQISATVEGDDGLTQGAFLRLNAHRDESHHSPLLQLSNIAAEIPFPKESSLLAVRLRLRGSANVMVRLECAKGAWRRRVLCTGNWQTIDDTFRVDAKAGQKSDALSLLLQLEGATADAATLDLRELSLRSISFTALAAASSAISDYPANLLRVTRFPLGRPATWTFLHDRYGSIGASATGDASNPGPSEFPSLRVQSDLDEVTDPWYPGQNGIPLISEPFVIPDCSTAHIFSCFVKGSGTLQAEIHHGWKTITASPDLELTDAWQRISLRFNPELYSPKPHQAWFSIRPSAAGQAVWIADVQLERASDPDRTEASAYRSRYPAEIQLGFERPWHLHFSDEAAELSWAASGELADAILHVRVTDCAGQIQNLAPIQITEAHLQTGTVRYAEDQERLGQVRVDAWLTRNHQTISNPDELTILRVQRPRHWGEDAPNSFFGIHAKAHPHAAQLAKALGFNWNRDWGCNWETLERKPGALVVRRERLQVFRDAHLLNMPVLAGTPDWAKRHIQGLTPPSQHAPPELPLYADFVQRFLAFHHGQIAAIEIGNEPWISKHWCQGIDKKNRAQPFADPWQEFIDMTKAGMTAARAIDPAVLVVGVNAGSGESASGRGWAEAMLARGALETCDVASFHCYNMGDGIPGDGFERKAAAPVASLKSAKPNHPVWMTEGSPNAHLLGQGLNQLSVPGAQVDTELRRRGDRLVRYCLALMAVGTDKAFLYTMGGAGFWEGNEDWGWRILTDPYGQPLPEAAAISNCAWHLEDAHLVHVGWRADGTAVYLFSRADGAGVAVLCDDLSLAQGPGFVIPSIPGVIARDLLGNHLNPGDHVVHEVAFLTLPAGVQTLTEALALRE